jgi:hypothetical protein
MTDATNPTVGGETVSVLPEYGEWLPGVWDSYLRDLVGWENVDRWARLPATFRWHEFHARLDAAITKATGGQNG